MNMRLKQQLLTALAIFLAIFATAQEKTITLTDLNLKGKVRSVNEITYDAAEKFGEVVKGKKTDREFHEFNTAGNEVQVIEEDFEEEDEKFSRTIKYNSDNLPVEIKESQSGESGIMKFKYNGREIESIDITDKKGKLLSRQKNTYKNGLLAQEDSYNGEGKLTGRSVYTYDSKKQLVKCESFGPDGKQTYETTFAYDSRGNNIEASSVNYEKKEKDAYIRKYAYNQKNQKTEERNSVYGLDKKEVFEYNIQGDLVKKEDYHGSEEKVYTYDSQNNWITCTITKKIGSSTWYTIVERQIKYY